MRVVDKLEFLIEGLRINRRIRLYPVDLPATAPVEKNRTQRDEQDERQWIASFRRGPLNGHRLEQTGKVPQDLYFAPRNVSSSPERLEDWQLLGEHDETGYYTPGRLHYRFDKMGTRAVYPRVLRVWRDESAYDAETVAYYEYVNKLWGGDPHEF